ncbi:DUF3304 domain-containing protein [Duganella sp. CY15W]|uniref:DUF3304 domain-containing protein n=1 Tax=Duganella sp. CY15W TaxID=2692172 RepID=UPI0013694B41|nr:DUF3304 domain-containing protein [Duganella sp. CY15W]MYM27043.1 DUF3304 domain-containing protein [Duganella sp. CY15W]
MKLKNTVSLAVLFAGVMALLASCAFAQPGKPTAFDVGVRSINYSGKEVALIVVDPKDKSNSGGGNVLNPYSMGGGTICCFSIPSTWKSGYQVLVKYSFYPEKTWNEQLVDVPPYAEGVAGDIWLAMHEDGRAEAVVSNFGPTRPEWPGRVKGRPVATEKYELKVRNEQLNTQKGMLAAMEKALENDSHKLTPEEIEKLKKAIEDTRKRVRLMEEMIP